jgi:hypothetical protein
MRKKMGWLKRLLLILVAMEIGIFLTAVTITQSLAEQQKPTLGEEQSQTSIRGKLSLVKATNFPEDFTRVLVIETAQGERFALYGKKAVELRKKVEELKDKEITVTGKRRHFKTHTYLGEKLVTVEVLQYTDEIEDVITEEQNK